MPPPDRKPAPHVLAATSAVQARTAIPPVPPPRPLAPHAQQAVTQARLAPSRPSPASAPARTPAPNAPAAHVRHAVAQARMPPPPAARPAVPGATVPATQRSLQPYSIATLSGNKGKLSDNEKYFVTAGKLFVLAGATDPVSCSKTMDKITPKKGTFYQWEGSQSFLKDCLHTAEEVMAKKTFDYEKGGIRSQSRDSDEEIGVSDNENQRIANALSQKGGAVNANADPAAGQAYLIVEMGNVKAYPYHAAGVVAVDGTDRVTLEMFAGTQEAKNSERKYPGKFEMYGAGNASFHDAYAGAFTNPVTIVIKKK